LVLLILAVVWAIFLVPQLVRARAEKTPADSIGAFRAQLSVLERATPAVTGRRGASSPGHYGRQVAALRRQEAARRRRDVLTGLVVAMAATFLLGMLPAFRVLLPLHVALDVLFFAYIGMLARARAIATERETKVRRLHAVRAPEPTAAPEPLVLLRNYGS
jgi:hypothetical protein